MKNLQSTYRKKLKKLLKTELRAVYVTTNNKSFLSLNDAIDCENEQEKKREKIKKKEEIIMNIYDILSKVLSRNDWGVFFKGEPLQNCPVQEGAKMYKVNEVNIDRLHSAIEQVIIEENNWSSEERQTDNE
jgi:hypothetical protein